MTDIFLVASTVSWAVFGTCVAQLQKSVDTAFPPKERGIASLPCKGGITFLERKLGVIGWCISKIVTSLSVLVSCENSAD